MQLMELPVDNIRIDPDLNPRTVMATKEQNKELLQSIKAVGIINPISVAKNGQGYVVVAGNRRFLAAVDAKLDMIPVNLVEANARISFDENVQRARMHPADEVVAFKEASEGGKTNKAIGNSFGVTESVVGKRLALANLSPEVVKLWRANKMNIESAQAFAGATVEIQDELVKRYKKEKREFQPYHIRFDIQGQVPGSMIKLAGEEYIKRGLSHTSDLFEETIVYHDLPGMTTICEEMMRAAFKATGIEIEANYQMTGYWDFDHQSRQECKPDEADQCDVILLHSGEIEFRTHKAKDGVVQSTASSQPLPDPDMSMALSEDMKKIRREAWVRAVYKGEIECESLAREMVISALTLDPGYVPISELSRRETASSPQTESGFDAAELTQLIVAYFYNVNNIGDEPHPDAAVFNLRNHWTPDREFFKRMKSAVLNDIFVECSGINPFKTEIAFLQRREGKVTKADWLDMLALLFNGEINSSLDEAAVLRTMNWVPNANPKPSL